MVIDLVWAIMGMGGLSTPSFLQNACYPGVEALAIVNPFDFLGGVMAPSAPQSDQRGAQRITEQTENRGVCSISVIDMVNTLTHRIKCVRPEPSGAPGRIDTGAQHRWTTMNDEAQFDFDSEDSQPDIYVAETFVNSYGDKRAVLEGDTYEAKDIIKFDWETTHHSFNDRRKVWVVDEDSLDILATKLQTAGYTFAYDQQDSADEDLAELAENVRVGDRIEVTYEKKNGNGENTYEGEITRVKLSGGSRKDQYPGSGIRFEDTDGKTKWIKHDDNGIPSLFSNGYHPFMGTLVSVTVTEEAEVEA